MYNIFICEYCNKECKNKKSHSSHKAYCKLNPNSKYESLEKSRFKAMSKISCKFCDNKFSKAVLLKHEKSCFKNPEKPLPEIKTCPICEKNYTSKSKTCSYSCSNTYFRHSNPGGIRYKDDACLREKNDYKTLCFRYHKKKCVCCDEDKLVSVHHLNGDHYDNRIENLIPMCQTHHQYWHSKYRYVIEDAVNEYIDNWKKNNNHI